MKPSLISPDLRLSSAQNCSLCSLSLALRSWILMKHFFNNFKVFPGLDHFVLIFENFSVHLIVVQIELLPHLILQTLSICKEP